MNLNWSNRVIKYVLFVFNFLFVISGIILIGVGTSVKAYYTDYDIFLADSYFSLPNLLIATGSLIFFISFFGCCGALRESWLMIFIFSILLSLIFILEFSGGIAGYVLRDKTSEYLRDSLLKSIPEYKPKTNTATMWDLIQTSFQCCGADGPMDWKVINTDPKSEKDDPKSIILPATCCKSVPGTVGNSSCTSEGTDTAIPYEKGCIYAFGDYLKSHAVTLGGVAMGIAFVQLFGIIFACHLTKQIKHGFYST